ncbi:hypothetical protein U0070_021721 [Myodes glareolus]|uniref:Uncharacterized protein n=1 Tax=Myodes glareolus TaxID=447135 RepID=A0AAW0HSH1_MYOGA
MQISVRTTSDQTYLGYVLLLNFKKKKIYHLTKGICKLLANVNSCRELKEKLNLESKYIENMNDSPVIGGKRGKSSECSVTYREVSIETYLGASSVPGCSYSNIAQSTMSAVWIESFSFSGNIPANFQKECSALPNYEDYLKQSQLPGRERTHVTTRAHSQALTPARKMSLMKQGGESPSHWSFQWCLNSHLSSQDHPMYQTLMQLLPNSQKEDALQGSNSHVLLGFQKPTHGNKGAGTSLRATKGPGAMKTAQGQGSYPIRAQTSRKKSQAFHEVPQERRKKRILTVDDVTSPDTGPTMASDHGMEKTVTLDEELHRHKTEKPEIRQQQQPGGFALVLGAFGTLLALPVGISSRPCPCPWHNRYRKVMCHVPQGQPRGPEHYLPGPQVNVP